MGCETGRDDEKPAHRVWVDAFEIAAHQVTNAFSKKLENLKAVLALHFAWYNFCRVRSSLRTTPAMAASPHATKKAHGLGQW